MANGLFDPAINAAGWFDDDSSLNGWFDDSLLSPGSPVSGVSGAVSIQLDSVAVAYGGTTGRTGTVSVSLDSITVSSSAQTGRKGVVVVSLDGVSLSSSGGAGHSSVISATIDDVGVSFGGAVEHGASSISGAFEASLDGVLVEFVGSVPAKQEILQGGGGYSFLDPEWHKRRIKPKVKRIISKLAKRVVSTPEQEQHDVSAYIAELMQKIEDERLAWNRFYADLLAQQIESQRLEQIRIRLELIGVYQQIEEDDERELMMLLMEM